jgi:hypothetical protein
MVILIFKDINLRFTESMKNSLHKVRIEEACALGITFLVLGEQISLALNCLFKRSNYLSKMEVLKQVAKKFQNNLQDSTVNLFVKQ